MTTRGDEMSVGEPSRERPWRLARLFADWLFMLVIGVSLGLSLNDTTFIRGVLLAGTLVVFAIRVAEWRTIYRRGSAHDNAS